MVSTKEWEEQRRILLERGQYLFSKISEKEFTEESLLELYQGDGLDKATVSRDLEIGYMIDDREREELMAINTALNKIKQGTYGICERCGNQIDKERLLALPLTLYCRDCQLKMESSY